MCWLLKKKIESDEDLKELNEFLYYSYHHLIKGENRKNKANELLKKIKNPQTAEGQYIIGMIYLKGYGVDRNYRKAIKLLKKAGYQGHIKAADELSFEYLWKKPKEADMWHEIAISRNPNELFNRGNKFYYGEEYIKLDYVKAAELYQKAADQGHAEAQFKLGTMYADGLGVPKDYNKAAELYQKAADQGNTEAICKLASMYYYGFGKKKNYNKAEELYQRAIDLGDTSAKYYLDQLNKSTYSSSNSNYTSSNTSSSKNKAWLEQAEYYLDRGYESRAIAIIEEAASKGDPDAKELLYKFYKGKREIEDKYARQETINLVNQLAGAVLENAENERQKTIKELEDLKRDLEIEEYRAKERYQREKMYAEIEVEREIKKALENRK